MEKSWGLHALWVDLGEPVQTEGPAIHGPSLPHLLQKLCSEESPRLSPPGALKSAHVQKHGVPGTERTQALVGH